jgi:hypothetical protein
MRNQYVLGYNSKSESAGKWREIKVRVNSPAVKKAPPSSYKRGYAAAEK